MCYLKRLSSFIEVWQFIWPVERPLKNFFSIYGRKIFLLVYVFKIQVNPIHIILKYGDYYDFMDYR